MQESRHKPPHPEAQYADQWTSWLKGGVEICNASGYRIHAPGSLRQPGVSPGDRSLGTTPASERARFLYSQRFVLDLHGRRGCAAVSRRKAQAPARDRREGWKTSWDVLIPSVEIRVPGLFSRGGPLFNATEFAGRKTSPSCPPEQALLLRVGAQCLGCSQLLPKGRHMGLIEVRPFAIVNCWWPPSLQPS